MKRLTIMIFLFFSTFIIFSGENFNFKISQIHCKTDHSWFNNQILFETNKAGRPGDSVFYAIDLTAVNGKEMRNILLLAYALEKEVTIKFDDANYFDHRYDPNDNTKYCRYYPIINIYSK